MASTLTPLRRPDFRRFWLGSGLSTFGSQLTELALPLLILDQTHSPVLAGVVGTARMITYMIVQLPAGVVADRLDRRALLLFGEVFRGSIVVVIGVALVLGAPLPIVPLALLMVAGTVMSAVADPTRQAAMRHLVGVDEMPSALALNTMSSQTMTLIVPLLGGVCYQAWPALPFLVDAASYAVSFVVLSFVTVSLGTGTRERRSILADVGVGLRFVWTSRFLPLYLVWSALGNFVTAGVIFVLVITVQPSGGSTLGLVMSVVALGGLAGAALAPRTAKLPTAWVVSGGIGLRLLAACAMAVHPTPVVLAVGTTLIILLGPSILIPYGAHVYTVVPDHLTARVQSAMVLVGGSLYPFAALATGLLMELTSTPVTLLTLAALFAVLLSVSVLPRMRLPNRS
ncbi:MFS transporter [Actinocrispum wychmicini]|uniref:Transmembrane secretion effector n=1 Tax=Actinocrispum wychmicini TaxID=1213861 RepID=A0A4R2JRV0_9PSEU|nr:MFS transporter [Actinocrispum wychmicini]TCO62284.1 transmembrane secretion effector [Actinocrispum wychmicini]